MKLVCLGNTIIDVTVEVDHFPEQGSDVIAHAGGLRAGGSGFNVMCAASRLGIASVYGGMHGTGPFGDAARSAMAQEGIRVAHHPHDTLDTGWDVAVTDASAERTFITVVGAESLLTAAHLAEISTDSTDVIYVSGYGLLSERQAGAIVDWIDNLPNGVVVVTDPGPLVAEIRSDFLNSALARTTWLSANLREAKIISGESDPTIAASLIAERVAKNGGGAVVRLGEAGCLVCQVEGTPVLAPGVNVAAIDTNGAGDAHVGAFIASLINGLAPLAAAERANAAAAFSVTRMGPATAPTKSELEQFLGVAAIAAST